MAKRKYTKKSKSKMSSYKDGSKGYIKNQQADRMPFDLPGGGGGGGSLAVRNMGLAPNYPVPYVGGVNYMPFLVPTLGLAGAAQFITANQNNPEAIEDFISKQQIGPDGTVYQVDEFGRPVSANMKYTEGTVNPASNSGRASFMGFSYPPLLPNFRPDLMDFSETAEEARSSSGSKTTFSEDVQNMVDEVIESGRNPGTITDFAGSNLRSIYDPETGEARVLSPDILDQLSAQETSDVADEQAAAEQAQLGMPNVMFLKERRARRGNRIGAGNFIPVNQLIAEQQAQIARGETPTFDEDATYYTNLRQARAMGLRPKKAARFMRRNFGYTPVNQGNMQAPGFFGALLRGMPTVGTGNLAYQQGLRGGRGLAVGSALGALQNIAQGFAAAAPGMGGASPNTEANTQALNAAMATGMADATGGQGAAAAGRAAGAAGAAAAAGRAAGAATQPSGRSMGEILFPGGTPQGGTRQGAATAAGMMTPTADQIMNMSRAQRNQLAMDQGFDNYRQMARGTVIPTDGAFTFPGSVARDIRSTQRFNREPLTPRRELIAQQVAQQLAQQNTPPVAEERNQADDRGFPTPPGQSMMTRRMDAGRMDAGRMKGSPVPQYGVTVNKLKDFSGDFMDSAMAATAAGFFANGGYSRHQEKELVDLNTLQTKGYINEDGEYVAPDPRLSDQMDLLDYIREGAIVAGNELGKSATGLYEGIKDVGSRIDKFMSTPISFKQNGGYTRNQDVAPVLSMQSEVAPLMGGTSSTGSASTARELAQTFGSAAGMGGTSSTGSASTARELAQTLQSAAGTGQMTGGMGQGIAKLLGDVNSADNSAIMKALGAAAERKQNGGYSRNQDVDGENVISSLPPDLRGAEAFMNYLESVPDTKTLGDDMSAVNAAKRLYYDMLAGEGAQSDQAGQLLRMMFSPVSGLAEGIASAIYPFLSEEQQKKDDAAKARQAQATQDLEEYKQSLKEQGKYKTPFETVKGFFGLEQNGGYSRNMDSYSEYAAKTSNPIPKSVFEARGKAMGNPNVAQDGMFIGQNEPALDAAIRQQAALASAMNAGNVINRENRFEGMLNQMPMMMGLDAGMYTSLVPLEVNTEAVNDMNRMV